MKRSESGIVLLRITDPDTHSFGIANPEERLKGTSGRAGILISNYLIKQVKAVPRWRG